MMTEHNNQDVYSDLAIPPGEYLEEVIAELGMSKDELSKRGQSRQSWQLAVECAGRRPKCGNGLFRGDADLIESALEDIGAAETFSHEELAIARRRLLVFVEAVAF